MAYLVKTAIDYIENLEDGNFYPLQDTAYTALDVSVATVFAS